MKEKLAVVLAAAAATLSFALPARAGIEACGNIHVEASAKCETRGGIECTGACEPLRFEAACAGELYVDCRGSECTATVTAECQGSCDIGACEARCEVDEGRFDCSADCQARAEADCSAKCQAEANQGECQAACKATVSGECDAACDVEPATANCRAKCEAACQGECRADSSVDCQIDCQARGFGDCQANIQSDCEVDCTSRQGALFCDNQYVDHGGNLEECIDALRAELNITVTASGSAQCEGNECTAEGEAACSCSAPGARNNSASGTLLGVIALGLVAGAVRRRRRR